MKLTEEFKKIGMSLNYFFTENPQVRNDLIKMKLDSALEEKNVESIKKILRDPYNVRNQGPYNLTFSFPYDFTEGRLLLQDLSKRALDYCIKNNDITLLKNIVSNLFVLTDPSQEKSNIYSDTILPLIEKKDFDSIEVLLTKYHLIKEVQSSLSKHAHELANKGDIQELSNLFQTINERYSTITKSDSDDKVDEYFAANKLQKINQDIKQEIYIKLLDKNDTTSIKQLMKDDRTFNLDHVLLASVLRNDNSEALKAFILNTPIPKDTNYQKLISPTNIFISSAQGGSVNCMKFAIEYNNEPFSKKVLEDSLTMSVKWREASGVKYLLENFKDQYDLTLLNTLALKIPNSEEVVKTMKEIVPEIAVELPRKTLEDKIQKLREKTVNNTSENTLQINKR